MQEDVIFTGFVTDEELPHLYDGACLFVYLSLFEGFGLPPLEAMARGVPVVTSNTTSLPEVVGDAGIMVSPRSLDDVVEGMRRVLTDAALADKMRQAGKTACPAVFLGANGTGNVGNLPAGSRFFEEMI